MRIYNQNRQKKLRRNLKQQQSEPEKILWQRLRARQVNNLKFRRQVGIGRYVADFYCPQTKLVIELDGDSHYYERKNREYDAQRDLYMKSLGLKVIRFFNTDIIRNIDGVLAVIVEKATTSP